MVTRMSVAERDAASRLREEAPAAVADGKREVKARKRHPRSTFLTVHKGLARYARGPAQTAGYRMKIGVPAQLDAYSIREGQGQGL